MYMLLLTRQLNALKRTDVLLPSKRFLFDLHSAAHSCISLYMIPTSDPGSSFGPSLVLQISFYKMTRITNGGPINLTLHAVK